MALELPFSPAAASVRSSGFVLDDSLRRYAGGVSLDLLASLLLVWATVGLRGLPLRLSLAFALFGCLHLFGGWQREPQELAFSVTVLLCVLGLGAHARSLAARRARHETLLRSACWAEYWQGQLVGFLRQVAFEAVAVLAILALSTVELSILLKAVGHPSQSESQPAIAQARAALGPSGGDSSKPGFR
jgi:hypothetical protein